MEYIPKKLAFIFERYKDTSAIKLLTAYFVFAFIVVILSSIHVNINSVIMPIAGAIITFCMGGILAAKYLARSPYIVTDPFLIKFTNNKVFDTLLKILCNVTNLFILLAIHLFVLASVIILFLPFAAIGS
mgnify:CR=1 FL=1|tara:strand:- start:37 stop:426 length:390 start_codon:yes stop_codon:yes gene_type:complete